MEWKICYYNLKCTNLKFYAFIFIWICIQSFVVELHQIVFHGLNVCKVSNLISLIIRCRNIFIQFFGGTIHIHCKNTTYVDFGIAKHRFDHHRFSKWANDGSIKSDSESEELGNGNQKLNLNFLHLIIIKWNLKPCTEIQAMEYIGVHKICAEYRHQFDVIQL